MVAPISSMAGDLTRRITKIEKAIDLSARDSIRAGAKAAKGAQLDVMRADAGGNLRLDRVRSGRGAAIGARFDVTGVGQETTATIKATGPVPLLANQTKAHTIPKLGGKRLSIPGIGVRASANHPGTRGKDTWNEGRRKAEPEIQRAIARESDAAVKRAFLSGG